MFVSPTFSVWHDRAAPSFDWTTRSPKSLVLPAPCLISHCANFAIAPRHAERRRSFVSQVCAGGSANLREREGARRRFDCSNQRHCLSVSVATRKNNGWRDVEWGGGHTVAHSVHNKCLLRSNRNLIWFHIDQWNSAGWEASEQSVFVMWSTDWARCVNVCTGVRPHESCRKRNLSGAGLSLYLPPALQQQGIRRIIFQRSVHFSYRLAFYVLCTPARGRTAVWAPHPLSFRGRTHF